jgi:cbb3-type cytochrome oxidase subunit 1
MDLFVTKLNYFTYQIIHRNLFSMRINMFKFWSTQNGK